jgi:quinol monooxygenase YgiN
MKIGRREAIRIGGAAAAAFAGLAPFSREGQMYGLIGKMSATPGSRDALIEILLDGVAGMPGCLSYVVARDPADADSIWITEVWDSKESHQASLSLPAVKQAIAKGRPLIAAMGESIVTTPVGGHGLAKPRVG